MAATATDPRTAPAHPTLARTAASDRPRDRPASEAPPLAERAGRMTRAAHDPATRRPIRARGSRWAGALAGLLARFGVTPNAISLASVVVAAGAGGALALSAGADGPGRAGLLLLAASLIQARLLCNLLDGMVAVEGGRGTPAGPVYNELPDRAADTLILVGAGLAVAAQPWGATLGWAAAVLAVTTAYVRALGAALGAGHHFVGLMAKQHRMAVVTAACVLGALAGPLDPGGLIVAAALGIVAAGSLVTIARRTRLIVRNLEAR